MPRTIWPPDPRWTSSQSDLRGCAGEFHHETLRRIFALPPRLSSPKQISSSEKEEELSRSLSFRGYRSCQAAGAYLSQLKPDDVKIFCRKDCAVYGLTTGLPGQLPRLGSMDPLNLLESGYRA